MKLGVKLVSTPGVDAAVGQAGSGIHVVVEILVGRPSSAKVAIVSDVKSTAAAGFAVLSKSLGPGTPIARGSRDLSHVPWDRKLFRHRALPVAPADAV
jgi:hypothetical protein